MDDNLTERPWTDDELLVNRIAKRRQANINRAIAVRKQTLSDRNKVNERIDSISKYKARMLDVDRRCARMHVERTCQRDPELNK